MCARENDLRAARRALYLNDVGAQCVPVVILLRRQLFRRHEHRLGTPDINENVAPLDTLYNACHDIRRAVHVLIVDNPALSLSKTLHDDLLCSLCSDTSEVRRGHLNLDHIANLIVRVYGARLCKRNVLNVILRVLDNLLDGKDVECPCLS